MNFCSWSVTLTLLIRAVVASLISPFCTKSYRQSITMTSEGTNPEAAGKVDHNYHDYSQVTLQEEAAIQPLLQIGTVGDPQANGVSNFSDRNFPAKLHFVLSELEKDGMSDICGKFIFYTPPSFAGCAVESNESSPYVKRLAAPRKMLCRASAGTVH
jgi:hypothetical protein